jgi:phosphoglucosamine mutase
MSRLFGTDGIRAKAGTPPLDAATVCRVGAALVRTLHANGARPHVLIGGDTRESFGWIEEALARGLTSQGANATSVGILPTPGVAYLASADEFHAGVVVSASHNPYEDNGIKIFSGRGEKLDEDFERRIEALVADTGWRVENASPALARRPELRAHYVDHLLHILPRVERLAGSRVVIDCGNGATATIAPQLFRDLGLDVIVIGNAPDGRNINLQCGSTHLGLLQQRVVETAARLGVAFDGDGDRALFVDDRGRIVDGDAVLLLAAIQLQHEGRLPGDAVVATVMSNIGLELALRDRGIALLRAPVGDKYVMEQMQAHGIALGGEQSGHIIFAEHLYTGDGIGTALQVLRVMEATGKELRELAADLVTYPQVLVNVRVRERADYTKIPAIAESIKRVEGRVEGQGRLLIRYSGTEPLLRIMIEGKDDGAIRQWADEIADAVRSALGPGA